MNKCSTGQYILRVTQNTRLEICSHLIVPDIQNRKKIRHMLFLGIISLILGALILYKMVRHPFKYDDGAINFKGYASGIIFISIGIYVILDHYKIL